MTRFLGFAFGSLLALTPRLAHADDPPTTTTPPDVAPDMVKSTSMGEVVQIQGADSRSTAEEFLVLPDGADVGGRLRTVTADDGLGVGRLKLTDVALLDLNAEWAFARHFELDAVGSVLAKQPSATDEHVLQGGSLSVRRDLVHATAVALTGSVSPLVNLHGEAFGASLFVQHKHRLNEIVTFQLGAGADSTFIRPAMAEQAPYLVEAVGHAAVLVRVENVWGGWIDIGYAVPLSHGGIDPVSAMPLDPQPRLDITLGTAVQLAKEWDLSFALSVIDRGDASNPATQLPILDGGFDQLQLTIGISRRIHGHHSDGASDDALKML
jgi:hypothetical protein